MGDGPCDRIASPSPDPEQAALSSELRRDLEAMIDSLAEAYRPVFVLREVEGLTTAETAEALGLSEDVVKTRLHRARAMLREALAREGQRPREQHMDRLLEIRTAYRPALSGPGGRDHDTDALPVSAAKRSSSKSAAS